MEPPLSDAHGRRGWDRARAQRVRGKAASRIDRQRGRRDSLNPCEWGRALRPRSTQHAGGSSRFLSGPASIDRFCTRTDHPSLIHPINPDSLIQDGLSFEVPDSVHRRPAKKRKRIYVPSRNMKRVLVRSLLALACLLALAWAPLTHAADADLEEEAGEVMEALKEAVQVRGRGRVRRGLTTVVHACPFRLGRLIDGIDRLPHCNRRTSGMRRRRGSGRRCARARRRWRCVMGISMDRSHG